MTIAALLISAILAAPSGDQPLPGGKISLDRVIKSLIDDLGADSYHRREAATEGLRSIGPPALKAVEKAAESDDPEVRLRAREVLVDLRLGITADWPADLVLMARHYDGMTDSNQRRRALRRIADALKEKAVPFLAGKVGGSNANEAEYALSYLMRYTSDSACRKIIELIDDPKTPQQARALAFARSRLGRNLDALEILDEKDVDGGIRNKVINAGVKELMEQLAERKYKEVAEAAERYAKSAKSDARFLYLRAEALAALGQSGRTAALQKQALALNPDEESPHYSAAEMLMKLGRRILSAREWEAILRIPPAGEVYDINAHLRLSAIYEASGLFEKAGESLQKALDHYLKAKADGHGMGMIGGDEGALSNKIRKLTRMAQRYPAGPDAGIEDEIGRNELRVNITVSVKDDKEKELRRELAKVAGVLTVNVQPRDLRLFDVAPATVMYDRDKKQIAVMLNGSPCGDPMPLELKGDKVRVAVNTLDCCYIFEIDVATGKGRKVERFEKDYVIKFEPGIELGALADVVVTINEKRYEWGALLKGVEFDFLPEVMKVSLQGTTPDGRRINTRTEFRVQEPNLKPIREADPE